MIVLSLPSIWIPFISFSSLIAVARTFKTMLSSSGESGNLCLVPDLSGNSFSFLPLRMMLAMGLSYMAFYDVEVGSLYAHFLEVFCKITNGCWILSKIFSASIETIRFFFIVDVLYRNDLWIFKKILAFLG